MSKAGRVLLINLVMPFLQSLHTPIHISHPCQQRAASNDCCGSLDIGCLWNFKPFQAQVCGACMRERGREDKRWRSVEFFMFVGFLVLFLNCTLIPRVFTVFNCDSFAKSFFLGKLKGSKRLQRKEKQFLFYLFLPALCSCRMCLEIVYLQVIVS